MSNLQHIHDTFERIADRYDHHAALEQEVCRRLLERTAFNRRAPMQIFDLGCGTGAGSAELKRTFRKAQVVGLDTSVAMLSRLRRRSNILRPLRPVCADISVLPFAARTADLVFSNLASIWCPDPMAMFSEFRRILRPDGMLLFSTLGPGTFRELTDARITVDPATAAPEFPDLLEIGDALMAAGFREPVMDTERIVLSYSVMDQLMDELEATGSSLLLEGWSRAETVTRPLETAYRQHTEGGKYPVSYEVIYGVAYGPADGQPVKTRDGDVATFSVDALRGNIRKKS